MSKLTDKLRLLSGWLACAYQDAADEIDRLTAEVAKMRAALMECGKPEPTKHCARK